MKHELQLTVASSKITLNELKFEEVYNILSFILFFLLFMNILLHLQVLILIAKPKFILDRLCRETQMFASVSVRQGRSRR